MKQKILKKTMVISGVVGSIVLLHDGAAHAVENINNVGQASHEENVNAKTSNKGQVVGVGSTCLRIRELPSTDSNILQTMREGMTFDIISKDDGWYKIKYGNIEGYVFGEYVEEINSSSTENVLYSAKVYNISTNLRVRSGASLNASIIGYLVNDTKVSIVATEGDWYKIKYNGAYGYVHKDYISVNGNNNGSGEESDNNGNSGEDTTVKSTGYAYNLDGASLRIREKPSTNSNILGNIYEGDAVNIIAEENNWYKISYNNRIAYVSKDYVTSDKPSDSNNGSSNGNSSNDVIISKGKVVNIDTNLRVRQGASTSHLVIGYLLNNDTVDILGKEGNWYKIKYSNAAGYVSADYIKINGDSNSGNESGSTGNSGNESSTSDSYNTILNLMKAQIGSPYVWGGSGEYLTNDLINSLKGRFPVEAADGNYADAEQYVDQGYRAFDCSGLMQWAFGQANISIPRTTYEQVNCGVEVSRDSIKPGDLIFSYSLGHVGMYVGNNQYIDSPNVGQKIAIRNVQWGHVERIRRILN